MVCLKCGSKKSTVGILLISVRLAALVMDLHLPLALTWEVGMLIQMPMFVRPAPHPLNHLPAPNSII